MGWKDFCVFVFKRGDINATMGSNQGSLVENDRTFGSAKLFGQTSTVRFGPNDRTFFCRTQNFFFFILHSMPMASFHIFALLNEPHVCGVIIGL